MPRLQRLSAVDLPTWIFCGALPRCRKQRTSFAPWRESSARLRPTFILVPRRRKRRSRHLSASGALARYRIIHFATHGLLAGETEDVAQSLAEPALLLTPPDVATERDDGLLTASEVARLKLDADWVVLSACNTAGGGEKGDAEALSGLARAFFYAGARALLVSHWYVDSHAAVILTTKAFAAMKADPAIGRAEAMRLSVLAAMSDRSRPGTLETGCTSRCVGAVRGRGRRGALTSFCFSAHPDLGTSQLDKTLPIEAWE